MKKQPIEAGKLLRCLGVTVLVVLIDQLTKFLAVRYLAPVDTVPLIRDVLHLTYCTNPGAAFGMLADHRAIFLIISVIAILGMGFLMCLFHRAHPLFTVSLAMIVGGGIGNMIDRIFVGEVVDFIDFRLINFAIFNGADSFVTVGCVLLAVYLLFIDGRTETPIFRPDAPKTKEPSGEETGDGEKGDE